MKKFILSAIILFVTSVSFSQDYYKAYMTEMYTFNPTTKEWDLYQKNSDMDIVIVIEEEFLTFQAKSPSMFKIYNASKQEIDEKKLEGYRYESKDLRQDMTVYIDIIRFKESNTMMISIINKTRAYNLRYFVKPVQ